MRIGVLTSGGDAPGMNAALRTVVIAGTARGHEVVGIRRGYAGLLEGDAVRLGPGQVEGISRQGGTMLGSARSSRFPTDEGQEAAQRSIATLGLDALIVIGGNGSLTGAHRLAQRRGARIIGIPASIDNDIGHSGLAIGVDTAVNTIVDACDRISDTARAHRRAFIVEVMGRRCGFLAMRAGIAATAEAIVVGERSMAEDELVDRLRRVLRQAFRPRSSKKRVLILLAEGVGIPCARLIERLRPGLEEDAPGVDLRGTVLGHVVRGGRPSALDRVVAQRLAYGAVQAALGGSHDVMVSWEPPGAPGQATLDPSVRLVPLADVLTETDRLLDGTSPITKARVELLAQVDDLLAL